MSYFLLGIIFVISVHQLGWQAACSEALLVGSLPVCTLPETVCVQMVPTPSFFTLSFAPVLGCELHLSIDYSKDRLHTRCAYSLLLTSSLVLSG